MGLSQSSSTNKTYVSVVGGKFSQKVEEGTNGATRREFKKDDGTVGIKWEILYDELDGVIHNVEFKSTDFGTFLNVSIDDVVMSLQTDSQYFQQFAKKLPSINFDHPVTIRPYDFTPSGETRRKVGIAIKQNGEKVQSYFYDPESGEDINGIPSVTEENRKEWGTDKDLWKIFFIREKKFLMEYIREHVAPILANVSPPQSESHPDDTAANQAFDEAYEPETDEIPF